MAIIREDDDDSDDENNENNESSAEGSANKIADELETIAMEQKQSKQAELLRIGRGVVETGKRLSNALVGGRGTIETV